MFHFLSPSTNNLTYCHTPNVVQVWNIVLGLEKLAYIAIQGPITKVNKMWIDLFFYDPVRLFIIFNAGTNKNTSIVISRR